MTPGVDVVYLSRDVGVGIIPKKGYHTVQRSMGRWAVALQLVPFLGTSQAPAAMSTFQALNAEIGRTTFWWK